MKLKKLATLALALILATGFFPTSRAERDFVRGDSPPPPLSILLRPAAGTPE